jgi:hypothetical protein
MVLQLGWIQRRRVQRAALAIVLRYVHGLTRRSGGENGILNWRPNPYQTTPDGIVKELTSDMGDRRCLDAFSCRDCDGMSQVMQKRTLLGDGFRMDRGIGLAVSSVHAKEILNFSPDHSCSLLASLRAGERRSTA